MLKRRVNEVEKRTVLFQSTAIAYYFSCSRLSQIVNCNQFYLVLYFALCTHANTGSKVHITEHTTIRGLVHSFILVDSQSGVHIVYPRFIPIQHNRYCIYRVINVNFCIKTMTVNMRN